MAIPTSTIIPPKHVIESNLDTDVFIVGGGPAGLAAAIAAREKGFQVMLADGSAPPIEKSCGEGMMPETLSALRKLGLDIECSEGQVFHGISFKQKNANVSADFPQGTGIGLRRTLLHERLVRRAEECEVRLLWQCPVLGIDGGVVQLARGAVRSKWIIGADGHGSRVRRWSGLEKSWRNQQRHARRRHYRVKPWSNYAEVYWATHAQLYLTPIGCDEVCIVVLSEETNPANFASALAEFPDLQSKLAGAELASRERGAVTAMRSLRRVQRGNVALLGDASGGVDAITGEGLRLAFAQAFALADAMTAGDLRWYEQAHRKLMRRPMLMGELMLWLGRNPGIRSRVICAMQNRPELFARMLAMHVGKGTPGELLSTSARLGWKILAA